MLQYKTPVHTPKGWVPTDKNQRGFNSNFSSSMTIKEAIELVAEEISFLNAKSATLFTSYEHVENNRLRKALADNPTASMQLDHDGHSYFFICDKWFNLEHNIYAISLAIRACRNMENWGIASAKQALVGFSLQNAGIDSGSGDGSNLPEWMQYLGLGPTATLEDANAIYRRRAKQLADEKDDQEMLKLNAAIDEARAELHD
jgi:hypothetical protein